VVWCCALTTAGGFIDAAGVVVAAAVAGAYLVDAT
jgi:hypothetical protein